MSFKLRSSLPVANSGFAELRLCLKIYLSGDTFDVNDTYRGFGARGESKEEKKIKIQGNCLERLQRALRETLYRRR